MIEKVNPSHPDKLADRIAGAMVDLAYKKQDEPKIAVELLLGHKKCFIITETTVHFEKEELKDIVERITGDPDIEIFYSECPQDPLLNKNQEEEVRCGDNGIFKGAPLTKEQIALSEEAHRIYKEHPFDGKYILDDEKFIVCQSNVKNMALAAEIVQNASEGILNRNIIINPIGEWTGGTDVDTGAVNRKLGSDMADSVTGGGLHGKDVSKADVSVNIYAFLKAQTTGEVVEMDCAIGDTEVNGIPYAEIVRVAKEYIDQIGGFEKLAEWGLY